MQLQNQNNQNSDSIKQIIDMVTKSGVTPEQYVKNLISSGKISKEQLQKAIDFANSRINK